MEAVVAALVQEEHSRFPVGSPPREFSYGTAGFRERADLLDKVIFRVGILAAIRSKFTKATIGLMITASHNPVQDNGVKVVDPLGEMMEQSWEGFATKLANTSCDYLPGVLRTMVQSTGCDFNHPARVVFARDTRPSGEHLAEILARGLELTGAEYTDCGILTTPQLHYMVRCINTGGTFGIPTEEGYYLKVAAAFYSLIPKLVTAASCVKLDGANGVGAMKVKNLLQYIHGDAFKAEVYNDGNGVLNEKCGADYVKSQQAPPQGLDYAVGDRCISFDGDADRIVYFYKNTEGRFRLLDGDKIASLAAAFLSEKLKSLQTDLSIGVVQTAYANGNSTSFLQDTLRIPVACTLTGVKHLHHKAVEFDVGIYFEANGHGTVVFSDRAIETFQKASEDTKLSVSSREAAVQLYALTQLINQAVGDAISDMLLVEVILMHRGWGCSEWDATYTELPNRALKVKVANRAAVKTTDYDRRCTAPEGLQTEIDRLVAQHPNGRSFVRPSGTEDVVRVYAEAETQVAADSLAVMIGRRVHELAGGTGDPPLLPT